MIHPASRRQTGHWRFDEPLVTVDFGLGPAQVDRDHLRIRPDALGEPFASQPGDDRRGRDCAKPSFGHADRLAKGRFELPAIARRAVADQMHRLLDDRQRLLDGFGSQDGIRVQPLEAPGPALERGQIHLAPVGVEQPAASASSVETPTTAAPVPSARPFAVARPTRNPVKDPGPIDTATASRSLAATPAFRSTWSTVGRSSPPREPFASYEASAKRRSSSSRATLWAGVAVSIASMRINDLLPPRPGPNPATSVPGSGSRHERSAPAWRVPGRPAPARAWATSGGPPKWSRPRDSPDRPSSPARPL